MEIRAWPSCPCNSSGMDIPFPFHTTGNSRTWHEPVILERSPLSFFLLLPWWIHFGASNLNQPNLTLSGQKYIVMPTTYAIECSLSFFHTGSLYKELLLLPFSHWRFMGLFYLPFELESSLHFKVIKNNAKKFINKYNSLDLAWKTTVIYRGIDIW